MWSSWDSERWRAKRRSSEQACQASEPLDKLLPASTPRIRPGRTSSTETIQASTPRIRPGRTSSTETVQASSPKIRPGRTSSTETVQASSPKIQPGRTSSTETIQASTAADQFTISAVHPKVKAILPPQITVSPSRANPCTETNLKISPVMMHHLHDPQDPRDLYCVTEQGCPSNRRHHRILLLDA